ncbi:serine hydrolase domain-containing protein [Frigoriglobus tundricola]|uniref:Beta-lactamase class C-like and penicillin binding proteins (PBPs) superfamily n=1 Tax=Frigoriglobus tundricola TaxID=2774151 RepID=A0A6M5YXM5_9BACT|nr:serine hydrolase domain-containing protein [Frigoriglobus tundricola]QJW98759.1 Beta-lactamase class C-like and penicillin binding proteins (PBPs) superfamily [Frigoriglobus tundricola]
MRCLVLVSVSLFAAASARGADFKPDLDRLAEPLTKDKPAVGLVVGVWADGKPQVYGYGRVTTAAGEAAPDGDTLFEIGSVTKALTGVLLADAVARKEVGLDDPANTHLPADLKIRSKPDRPVTLLHLATHRSGLPVQPPLLGLTARNRANPYADYVRPKLVRLMGALEPAQEPGAEYRYSNLGVGLLGHALVTAAKADRYDALVRERVCRPLGLADTGEALTGAQKARLARGHNAKLDPTDPWDFATLEACGGLRSSANDLLRFAAANLGEVQTPLLAVLKASHEKREPAGSELIEIGLCWHRLKLKSGEHVVWHNGGTGGFRSMVAFTPATKRAVVVLCAADVGPEVDKLALQALEQVQPK